MCKLRAVKITKCLKKLDHSKFQVLKLEKTKSGTDGVTESRPGIGPSRFNDAASSPI